MVHRIALVHLWISALFAGVAAAHETRVSDPGEARWLAGDHHIHSRYSVGWDRASDPPSPIVGGDAIYPIPMNAVMAKRFGLDWMVTTDHGGPQHSKVNLEHAYPELLESRAAVPEVLQFFGMEFDTPGADHSSLIMPHSHEEADDLHRIESRFNKREPWPEDPEWDTEPRMLQALSEMKALARPPLVIAHHPSRSAPGLGEYGMTEPSELRAWNDLAPDIAVGMEGAPGHQATAQMDRGLSPTLYEQYFGDQRPRGGYRDYPTMGGYDQMTARLGGFWDSMLGEGRRWWITANSDSHIHWSEGGADFWPGEYSKTYVLAEKRYQAIFDAIRAGRIFVTTGDLVSELWVQASTGDRRVGIGEALKVAPGTNVSVSIRFLDPDTQNHHGDSPEVERVDLIVGQVSGGAAAADSDHNPSAEVLARFTVDDWQRDGAYKVINYRLDDVRHALYLRVRGTNTDELEPEPDEDNEDAWQDLWFYSNPIFIELLERE